MDDDTFNRDVANTQAKSNAAANKIIADLNLSPDETVFAQELGKQLLGQAGNTYIQMLMSGSKLRAISIPAVFAYALAASDEFTKETNKRFPGLGGA